jgi:hypothetical protein
MQNQIQLKQGDKMTRRKLAIGAITGAFAAYFIVHPLIMIISFFMPSNANTILIKENIISEIFSSFSIAMLPWSLTFAIFGVLLGIFYMNNKDANAKKLKLIDRLQESLAEIKTLSGLLPICASCKNIRDDKGYWNEIEVYISRHSEAQFSHSICPECAKKLYPEICTDK